MYCVLAAQEYGGSENLRSYSGPPDIKWEELAINKSLLGEDGALPPYSVHYSSSLRKPIVPVVLHMYQDGVLSSYLSTCEWRSKSSVKCSQCSYLDQQHSTYCRNF